MLRCTLFNYHRNRVDFMKFSHAHTTRPTPCSLRYGRVREPLNATCTSVQSGASAYARSTWALAWGR
eukprot:scaffold187609_cov24-Tisochrysis_lutea.AAC.1